MGITYDGLFNLLKEKNLSKTELKNMLGISSATLAKLSKNEPVSFKVIEDICRTLRCQPGDILQMNNDENELLKVLLEEKDMQLKGGIYHQTQIKLAYNSNRIEGSQLTEDQTRYIFETNTIGLSDDEPLNVDDILETVNHFQCFDYMLDCAANPLTEDIIKEFHRILKWNTSDSKKTWFNVGEYKARPNMVGDIETTLPKNVQKEMQNLLLDYHAKKDVQIEDIIDFHYRFECIHPFQDGNGRVGRMIIFKECLKNNITPFVIDEKHKLFYYRGLKEYNIDNKSLIDTCLSEQDAYKNLIAYFMSS